MQKIRILCNAIFLLKLLKSRNFYRSMKIGSLIFAGFFGAANMLLAAPGLGQGTIKAKVDLDFTNEPLPTVFKSIEQQANLIIFYEGTEITNDIKVSIKEKAIAVENALNTLLKDKSYKWEARDNIIKITRKITPAASPSAGNLKSPAMVIALTAPPITGIVRGPDGKPLEAVNIYVKEKNAGTVTDAEGRFSIEVKRGDKLIISSVGYATKEIAVLSNEQISVMLELSNSPLDEVQIIAYGETSKRLNTGNVSTIKSEEIAKQPVSNPLSAMQGRIPGLLISQSTGMPGGFVNVQIRGQNSISNGNDPLYIVDGVPFPSQLLNNTNPAKGGSSLNFINPADIESIDVLKDADATAIYGSRGANGVILITTKKGRPGKAIVGVNVYGGVGKVGHFIDLLDTKEYLEMRREAFLNDHSDPQPYNAPDLLLWDTTRYTDWQKELMGRSAKYTDAQISISGGNENVQYHIGGGYHRETTVIPGDFSDWKGSAHFSLATASDNKRFRTLLSANFLSDNNTLPGDVSSAIPALAPDAPKGLNDDGSINWDNAFNNNPYSYLLLKYRAKSNNLVSHVKFSYLLLKSLELSLSAGYNQMQAIETSVFPAAYFPPIYNITSGRTDFVNNNTNSWIIEPQLNYHINTKYGKLSALLGGSIQHSTANGQDITASNFPGDASLLNLQAAGTREITSVTNTVYKYNAVFGRINYNWKDKYLVNLTGRRDGSSRFGPGKQFQNFGAVGAAWIFSQEQFIQKQLKFLSFGKLRFSYGTSGNDQIKDYRFLDLYFSTPYTYQNGPGVYPSRLFNPDLAWEQIRKLEGGLELGFIKDRILLSVSYYRNRSANQLVSYTLPGIAGITSVDRNLPAVVQNKGWELQLNVAVVRNKDFSWNSSINLTIPKSKLISFPDFENSSYTGSYEVGKPLGIAKVFVFGGVDPATGLYQFMGSDGKLTSTPNYFTDRTGLVVTDPKYYGGFTNSFTYKRVSLSLFFDFRKKTGTNLLYSYTFTPPGAGYFTANWPKEVMQRWKQPGDVSSIQKFTSQAFGPANDAFMYAGLSDAGYTDASFIKLRNVSVSYSLPERWIRKIHISNASIYMQAQNVFTITGYLGYDPETPANIPPLRVITGGLKFEL